MPSTIVFISLWKVVEGVAGFPRQRLEEPGLAAR